MKMKVASILLLMLCASHIGILPLAPAQEPPPPPAINYFPERWSEYSSEGGRFRIKFPAKPLERVTPGNKYKVYSLVHRGLLYLRVASQDYENPIDDPGSVKDLLQTVKTNSLQVMNPDGLRVLAERDVVVAGHAGLFLHFEMPNEVVRVQWVAAGPRLYTIVASSRKGSPMEMEGRNDFEKIALGFINSFHPTD